MRSASSVTKNQCSERYGYNQLPPIAGIPSWILAVVLAIVPSLGCDRTPDSMSRLGLQRFVAWAAKWVPSSARNSSLRQASPKHAAVNALSWLLGGATRENKGRRI